MKDLTNQEFMEIYSAYLPYSPMFRSVKGRIARVTIYGPYVDKISPFGNNIGKSISMGQLKGSFKLLLRPLSDLTKEIEHKGERFVPIIKLAKMRSAYHKDFDINRANRALISDIHKGTLYFDMAKKLLQWHFDLFNLHERGLALNLNDFEK